MIQSYLVYILLIRWPELVELKIGQKHKGRLFFMRHQSLCNFCDPHWEVICRTKWHTGTSEISTPPKIAVEPHFHARYSTKTITVFLPTDGEASWSLLPKSVFLLSGGTVQPENTYFCILKVTGQVWESKEMASINTDHSYHQRSTP